MSGILANKKGEILLLRRNSQNSSYQGCWQLPEGKIEFGEQPEVALSRELLEEIGTKDVSLKLRDVSAAFMCAKGEDYHIVRIIYDVQTKEPIILGKDHDECVWFSPQNAKLINQKIDGLAEILEKLF